MNCQLLKLDLGTVTHLNIGVAKTVATQFMEFKQLSRLGKRLGLSTFLFFSIPATIVKAQITPDESLPTSVEQLREIMKINGGERAGNNLFHSFEEFSIPEGMQAVFENATDIENIFTRITGESASSIDGILKTQGGANLFLVNPNGIIFGENAQLDVGGSFIATTADSIQFEGDTEFAASDSTSEPIITIDRPIGLNFNGNSGAIQVNGNGSQIVSDTRFSPIDAKNLETGLSVTSGKTLALLGEEITLPGGIITAEGGKVEIGSVNSGLVSFQKAENGLTFNYENITDHQNIVLTDQALLNASGEGAGAISLTGSNVSLSDSSFILIQNRGQINSGTINVNAFESLTLSGTSLDKEVSSGIRTESLGTGQGAEINISTKQLQLRDGAQIIGSTYSQAPGKNVSINASDFIEMFGGSISAGTFAEGEAGKVQLSTSRLEVMEGGSITSSTIGSGDGGEVTINADLIDVVGRVSIDRSNIAAVSFGTGNAGNLNINTRRLQVRDQALVNTSSRASGDAGSIIINVSELIEVSGTNKNFQSAIRAGVELTNSEARKIFGLPKVPSGNAGNIIINSPILNIIREGVVNVSNEGTGEAGRLSIEVKEINLFDGGNISAKTATGTGGNINLKTDQLQLDENSSITATAENDGDGGNVTINTTAILAKKNSEITANALAGTGGNIQINAQGLFLFPDSIIEASSQLGIDGSVRIDTLDTNLQQDLELLELNLITPEDSLANSCLARRNQQQGSFAVSQGSLSNTSESDFYDSGSITGIDNFVTPSGQEQLPASTSQSLNNSIPAQQAVETEDGRVFLVSAPQSVKSLICN